MRLYQMADAVRYGLMNTEELRETFLLEDMFTPGEIEFAYIDLDRTVIGGAVPTGEPLKLETEPELRAEYFLERRELGILNVGGAGSVAVDGNTFELAKLDCLYVGRGSKEVTFTSADPTAPAYFYLLIRLFTERASRVASWLWALPCWSREVTGTQCLRIRTCVGARFTSTSMWIRHIACCTSWGRRMLPVTL
jgi:5-keto 4-deoxyuronate isomerase